MIRVVATVNNISVIQYHNDGTQTKQTQPRVGDTVYFKIDETTIAVSTKSFTWGVVKGPGLIQQGFNFGGAVLDHITTGRKHASPELIQQRFTICKTCSLYKIRTEVPDQLKDIEEVGKCLHKKCGCYIHTLDQFPNKLAWESEQCPLKKW